MHHVRVPAFTTASALDLISPQSVSHVISLGTMIAPEKETSNITSRAGLLAMPSRHAEASAKAKVGRRQVTS